jgi:hypothetical protein
VTWFTHKRIFCKATPSQKLFRSRKEGVNAAAFAMLNEATQAWAEFDHNCKIHSEIGEAPITRLLAGLCPHSGPLFSRCGNCTVND